MGQCAFFSVSLFMLLLSQSQAQAGDDDAIARTKKELLPRPVNLKTESMSLTDALAALSHQTGNTVVDRRQTKSDAKLKLAIDNSTFWPALEAIAKAAGCGISTYQADGQVALVDAHMRSMSTIYRGIFRVTAKRINLTRDDEAGTHICTITLDIAWEPRFEPLFLDVGPFHVTYGADNQRVERQFKVPGQGKISVAGRGAIEVDIRLPTPARSAANIKSLEGAFQLIGPGKMLAFTFPKLNPLKRSEKPLEQTQEGVRVSLVEMKTASNRWSVEVHIDNPKGNPSFESFQARSWLDNNRITLENGVGRDRIVWSPRIGEESERTDTTATHAEILYSFYIPPKQNKGSPADWTLIYRTPGRIVEIGVPVAFKDLPLP